MLQSKETNEEPIVEKRKHVLPPHRTMSGDSNVRPPFEKEHLVKPKLDVNGIDTIIPPSTQGLFTEIEENFQVEDSLFGFGRYPTIPGDFPFAVSWRDAPSTIPKHILYQGELVDRVLIKLHTEGDKQVIGAKWHDGKVYPMYPNTYYVRETNTDAGKGTNLIINGEIVATHVSAGTFRIFGPGSSKFMLEIHDALDEGKALPAGVKILNIDDHGIDPFEFLGIER